MTIKNIDTDSGKLSGATVTLYYDELQKLSSALYKLQDDEEFTKRKDFWKLVRDIHFLFDIVKNSCVDAWTFESGFYHTLRQNGKDVTLDSVLDQSAKEPADEPASKQA